MPAVQHVKRSAKLADLLFTPDKSRRLQKTLPHGGAFDWYRLIGSLTEHTDCFISGGKALLRVPFQQSGNHTYKWTLYTIQIRRAGQRLADHHPYIIRIERMVPGKHLAGHHAD